MTEEYLRRAIEPILEPQRLIMFSRFPRYQPDVRASSIIYVEASCLACDETLPLGRAVYFCGEACERVFRERYPDLELPELRTDRKLPCLGEGK